MTSLTSGVEVVPWLVDGRPGEERRARVARIYVVIWAAVCEAKEMKE